jgi:hypothetical protein
VVLLAMRALWQVPVLVRGLVLPVPVVALALALAPARMPMPLPALVLAAEPQQVPMQVLALVLVLLVLALVLVAALRRAPLPPPPPGRQQPCSPPARRSPPSARSRCSGCGRCNKGERSPPRGRRRVPRHRTCCGRLVGRGGQRQGAPTQQRAALARARGTYLSNKRKPRPIRLRYTRMSTW